MTVCYFCARRERKCRLKVYKRRPRVMSVGLINGDKRCNCEWSGHVFSAEGTCIVGVFFYVCFCVGKLSGELSHGVISVLGDGELFVCRCG